MQKQLLAGLEVYIVLYIFLLILFGETVQSKNTICNIITNTCNGHSIQHIDTINCTHVYQKCPNYADYQKIYLNIKYTKQKNNNF